MQLFQDYFWKDGIPYGMGACEEQGYKIVMDPYRKRISIEHYSSSPLPTLLYDSAFLDFRHLKKPEHAAWQKQLLHETPEEARCLIRDHNDRALFIETYVFTGPLCRECRVTSLQGHLLSLHKMSYTSLGDPFDGVILFDAHAHIVMWKRYLFEKESQQFTELLEEQWDSRSYPPMAQAPFRQASAGN